jgi:Flp pilus assembly protein, ATPase CpaE
VTASTILVLDTDATYAESISSTLTAVGYSVTVTADADEAFVKTPDHHLVILDVVAGSRSAAELCREIRKTPTMATVPVLCIGQTDDVEERINFLEAGADDVIAKPFDPRELEARVEALLLRFQRSRDLAPVVSADGLTLARARRTVVCFSPKGGVGTTTIAVNIAATAAARRPGQVLLIDLNLQFGGVATHLDLTPANTLADAAREPAALREPEMLRSYATHHASGLHVLAAPATPEFAELVTPTHVEQLLNVALDAYELVVVDSGSHLDERVMAAFERADSVVLTVYPEISALRAMHVLLDYLSEAGSVDAKSTFVLNNMFAREILKLRDIESALGQRIAADLPYDPFVYLKAVNEGVPVVLGAPQSAAAQRLAKLSDSAFGLGGYQVPADVPTKKSGGLFGRRKR